MVHVAALAVQGLAVLTHQRVHLTELGHEPEVAVHGGKSDRGAAIPKGRMQVLRAAELIGLGQQLRDRDPLLGRPLARLGGAGHGSKRSRSQLGSTLRLI